MHEITPSQVTPAVRALFHAEAPTILRAFCVMAGGNAGRIFVDDADPPRYAFAWEADDGALYRGGAYTRELLAEVMGALRDERLVALGFRGEDASVQLFPPKPSAAADA